VAIVAVSIAPGGESASVGAYVADVAGHGVPAALLAVTLARLLDPLAASESPVRKRTPQWPHYRIPGPAELLEELSARFPSAREDTPFIIGHLYSTSYCNRSLLGEDAKRFEEDLAQRLRELNPDGKFGWSPGAFYLFGYAE